MVFLHLKLVVLDAFGRSKRVVSVHIDRRVAVLPVQLVGTGPLVGRLVEGVAHVVATVAFQLQRARVATLVVHHVHAHHVAVAEAAVVHPHHGELLDVCRQADAAAIVLCFVVEDAVATTAERRCHHGEETEQAVIDDSSHGSFFFLMMISQRLNSVRQRLHSRRRRRSSSLCPHSCHRWSCSASRSSGSGVPAQRP